MSRGLGRVERRIVELIAGADRLTATKIAWWVSGQAAPTPALTVSVRRALATLARKGLLVRDGREWMSAAVARRAEEQRQREAERAAREKAEQEPRASAEEPRQRTPLGGATTPGAGIDRLVKVLSMLGSDHDGEVLAAARQAEALRRRLGIGWDMLIAAPKGQPRPAQPYEVQNPALRESIDAARAAAAAVLNGTIDAAKANAVTRAANAVQKAVGARKAAEMEAALGTLRQLMRGLGL